MTRSRGSLLDRGDVMRILSIMTLIAVAAGGVIGQRVRLEDGWKGVKVFHTKRAEVEAIFGKGESISNGMFVSYSTDKAQIVFIFSDKPCSNRSSNRGSYQFEEGTVIEYWVNLKKPLLLNKLNDAKEDFASSGSARSSDIKEYSNTSGNILFTTKLEDGNEVVQRLWYMSTVTQRKQFRCSDSTISRS